MKIPTPCEVAFIRDALSANSIVLVDCGSAGGIDPIFGRLNDWGVARCYGFEPRHSEFVKLCNGPTTVFQQLAISDRLGRGDMTEDGVLQHRDNGAVEINTIDNLVATGRLLPPHIIKTDIEGHDYLALRGAEGCLATSIVCVKAEIDWRTDRGDGGFSAIHDLMIDRGFRLFGLSYAQGIIGNLQNSDVIYLRTVDHVPDRTGLINLITVAAALGFLEYSIYCAEKGYQRGFITREECEQAIVALGKAVFLPEIIPWSRIGVRAGYVFGLISQIAPGAKWSGKSLPKSNQLRRFSRLYVSNRLPWVSAAARGLLRRIRTQIISMDGRNSALSFIAPVQLTTWSVASQTELCMPLMCM